MIRWFYILFFGLLTSSLALANSWEAQIHVATAAIEQGKDATAPTRALIAALKATRNEDAADELIEALVEIGEADGNSPQALKQMVRREAPDALRAVIQGKFSWSLRGDAIMAHRDLEASDADLKAAIDLAMQDQSPQAGFIHSRGELLGDWLKNRSPIRAAELDAAPTVNASAEQSGLQRLRALGISNSVDQLMDSARRGDVEEVAALLAAGQAVNVQSNVWMSPLAAASTGACTMPGTDLTGNLAVMDLLLKKGADPNAYDARRNPILMPVVQQCPLAIVKKLLDGGAAINPVNMQDFTPLEMAFVLGKWDVAELMVARGARRDPAKLNRIFAETPSDPKIKALLARASSKGK